MSQAASQLQLARGVSQQPEGNRGVLQQGLQHKGTAIQVRAAKKFDLNSSKCCNRATEWGGNSASENGPISYSSSQNACFMKGTNPGLPLPRLDSKKNRTFIWQQNLGVFKVPNWNWDYNIIISVVYTLAATMINKFMHKSQERQNLTIQKIKKL